MSTSKASEEVKLDKKGKINGWVGGGGVMVKFFRNK
jgi:hypothetical protein